MSRDKSSTELTGSYVMNYEDTELTLGLPGESRSSPAAAAVTGGKNCTKRCFIETVDQINDVSESRVSGTAKSPVAKTQVIGWPPVRSFRKKALEKGKLVKVAVDGAPYLRKVDLEMYNSYQELMRALEDMFTCFTILVPGNYMKERKLMSDVKGMEYEPTYEDKDGDWMLVGDVPWKMFIESCKRIRLMKSSEAVGLAPRTPPSCSSTS